MYQNQTYFHDFMYQNQTYFYRFWFRISRGNSRHRPRPGSIKGFEVLKKIEKELDSRLLLNLEIDFGELYGGIRFPTRVHMSEKYKGGRYVAILKGISGWFRNQTTFTYGDYRFFEVKMDVTIE